ncbi:MAG: response regulator [Ferruginibacter sp.]
MIVNEVFFQKQADYDFNTHTMINALIIDDEVDICYLLSGMLLSKNIRANYVNTITAAIKELEDNDPQIIFLDNHLPDGLGLDYINQIKHSHPASKLVMITAHDTASDRHKAFSEGVDYFIAKPFSKDTLYKTVDQLID